MLALGVLGSGRGSNCRALLESIRRGQLAAEVKVVISDVVGAPILEIAREFGVPHLYLTPGKFRSRLEPAAEAQLVRVLQDAGVELVVLAGWMRIVKQEILQAFPRRIINIHPSLLPKFPGLAAWQQALQANEKHAGATVHFVDEQIDHGAIIAQREVPILPGDSAESLHARIQKAEHALYPAAIRQLIEEGAI